MTDPRPVLDLIDLVVSDMDATVAFYRRLGLEVPDPWTGGSGAQHVDVPMLGGAHLHFDNAELAKVYNAGWRDTGGGSTVVVGFKVTTREAVDQIYADLTGAGHTGRQPPWDAFWGARYAIVADPDGNDVGIMSPSDPARQGPPPA